MKFIYIKNKNNEKGELRLIYVGFEFSYDLI